MNIVGQYGNWDIYDELPEGWKIDKTAGSPVPLTVFITNGKSVFNGQKRALLKIKRKLTTIQHTPERKINIKQEEKQTDNYKFPTKSINILARKKFQEHLLKEIQFDLMVCEIEGWNKKEYIKELKKLINSIDLGKSINKEDNNQLKLF